MTSEELRDNHHVIVKDDLGRFFEACYDSERVLFSTFLQTGFREQEVMYLFWSDINPLLQTVRVTAKPELGFYPKRCEERQIPAPAKLIAELQKHTRRANCQFVFPSPTGSREQHMLDRCKAVAKRAGLDRRNLISRLFVPPMRPVCSETVSMCAPCSIGWGTSRSKQR